MATGTIDKATARLEAALARIERAQARLLEEHRAALGGAGAPASAPASSSAGGAARVMALVNSHEKLREEVADTLRDLDAVIEDLES